MATRRSARCSVGQPADLGELVARVGRAARARTSRLRVSRSVRSMPVVTSDAGLPSGAGHRLVGPGDQPQPALLGLPVADLRARRAACARRRSRNSPNASRSSRRDHDVARVAAEHLVAAVARGPLARLVEEQDPAVAVEHADQRLGRLGEDPGEGLADFELPGLGGSSIAAARVPTALTARTGAGGSRRGRASGRRCSARRRTPTTGTSAATAASSPRALIDRGGRRPEWRVLDVGCGPGALTAELAMLVGRRERRRGGAVRDVRGRLPRADAGSAGRDRRRPRRCRSPTGPSTARSPSSSSTS